MSWKQKTKAILLNGRSIFLIILLLVSLLLINPQPWRKGVAIVNVVPNSPAALAGITAPKEGTKPMSYERIEAINSMKIVNFDDFSNALSSLQPNQTVVIKTNKAVYYVTFPSNYTDPYLGLRVKDAPKSNVRKGLDLEGGVRIILRPEFDSNLTVQQKESLVNLLKQSIEERLNVYGLSDVTITIIQDNTGQYYLRIEIPGRSEEDAKDLVSSQGVFEAKIGNKTVFKGEDKDIAFVCTSSTCGAGLDFQNPCRQLQDGSWACGFRFPITLSPEAAKKQAEITKSLSIVQGQGGAYLNETLDLYLDGVLMDQLNIGAELRGAEVTQVSISGSGTGATLEEARNDALKQMKKLQTILSTGSLPVKTEIVEITTVSPVLGGEFVNNMFRIGFIAIVVVALILFLRYRSLKIILPIIFTMLSEVILIFGFAAAINWNLDLPSIAGILVAVGTGVDDQIVILDEILKRRLKRRRSLKESIKSAFYIILGSYATTVAAMFPLFRMSAALVKGLALTTIAGVTLGVLVTRPVFSKIIEVLHND